MKYATVRYVQVGRRYHELSSFDGTRRGVVFESDKAAAAALAPGRAEIDCGAIEVGLLPRGAKLVSRAEAGDLDEIMAQTSDSTTDEDPLAMIRLRFSINVLAERSGWISHKEDAIARKINPQAASRYESLVDGLSHSQPRQDDAQS